MGAGMRWGCEVNGDPRVVEGVDDVIEPVKRVGPGVWFEVCPAEHTEGNKRDASGAHEGDIVTPGVWVPLFWTVVSAVGDAVAQGWPSRSVHHCSLGWSG